MQELFDKLNHVETINDAVLLDTCFFFDVFRRENEHKLINFCSNNNVCMTSFNVGEVVHNNHHVDDDIRHRIRNFLHKNNMLTVLNINVKPGDWIQEKAYVTSIEPKLLEKIPDKSDAVLIAAAIKTKSCVITRDKHHLFTTVLENFLEKYRISVYNNFF